MLVNITYRLWRYSGWFLTAIFLSKRNGIRCSVVGHEERRDGDDLGKTFAGHFNLATQLENTYTQTYIYYTIINIAIKTVEKLNNLIDFHDNIICQKGLQERETLVSV